MNKINKHSNYDKKEKNEEHMKALDDFLLPGSVCALAAANNSADTLWFVQIKGEFELTTSVSDYYGHIWPKLHAGTLLRASYWSNIK